MTLFAADAVLYQGVTRWAFGLDNPNKAAAVLAFLLLVLLALAVRARREWAGWCWSALAAAVGCGLAHTFSRGGLTAFLAGAFILLIGLRKKLCAGRRWLPVVLAACALMGSAAWTGFAGRVANSSPAADASANVHGKPSNFAVVSNAEAPLKYFHTSLWKPSSETAAASPGRFDK